MSKIWGLLSTDSCRHTLGPTADILHPALPALFRTMIQNFLFNNIVHTFTIYHEEGANFYITHNMFLSIYVFLSLFIFLRNPAPSLLLLS